MLWKLWALWLSCFLLLPYPLLRYRNGSLAKDFSTRLRGRSKRSRAFIKTSGCWCAKAQTHTWQLSAHTWKTCSLQLERELEPSGEVLWLQSVIVWAALSGTGSSEVDCASTWEVWSQCLALPGSPSRDKSLDVKLPLLSLKGHKGQILFVVAGVKGLGWRLLRRTSGDTAL